MQGRSWKIFRGGSEVGSRLEASIYLHYLFTTFILLTITYFNSQLLVHTYYSTHILSKRCLYTAIGICTHYNSLLYMYFTRGGPWTYNNSYFIFQVHTIVNYFTRIPHEGVHGPSCRTPPKSAPEMVA